MTRRATIVMYHFVRDLARTRYPAIKGLDLAAFRGQLAYITRHYTVVTMEALMAAAQGESLPPRACLLTFDDGYTDHYTHVFPLLDEAGVQGSFFPSAAAVLEDRVLEVNKIHFALASSPDVSELARYLEDRIDDERDRYQLPPTADLVEPWYYANYRFDSRPAIFVKGVLQRALPDPLRAQLVEEVFRKFVTSDEVAFARELYVNQDQLRCMLRHGMFVGSHSYHHVWLDTLTPAQQEQELSRSLDFLRGIGVDTTAWVLCYPYGGNNTALIDIAKARGCRLGLGVSVEIADLDRNDALLLPRLDTNDLPKQAGAGPNEWTARA